VRRRRAAAINHDEAARLMHQVAAAIPDMREEDAPAFLDLLPKLAELDPLEPLYPLRQARLARNLRRPEEDVLRSLQIAEELARRRENKRALAAVLAERARFLEAAKPDVARRNYAEAVATFRELGDRRGISVTLHSLAELDRLQGRCEEARKGFEEALATFRELGDRRGISVTRLYLETTRAQEAPGSDLAPLREAAAQARECPDPYVAARSYCLLGQVLRQRGEAGGARDELLQGVATAESYGMRWLVAEMQASLAPVLAELSQPAAAAEAAQSALAFFKEQHVAHPHIESLQQIAARADSAPAT